MWMPAAASVSTTPPIDRTDVPLAWAPLMRSLPQIRRTLFQLVLVVTAILAVPMAGDQWLIRGVYVHWLEPESTAGMLMLAEQLVAAQLRPDRRNVLVIGDSRIAEGFSQVTANQTAAGDHLNFVRLGLPGTTPRVWALLLQRLDPRRDRFQAVYLMAPSLRDEDIAEDFANRVLDNAYLGPILGLGNLHDYPDSFFLPAARKEARDAVLFPALSLIHI